MDKKKFKVDSGILSSRDKLKDRFLFAGKIAKAESDSFFVYVIEILSPWFPSTKVESTITGVLRRSFLNKKDFSPEDFENVLQAINAELGNLASQGENDWIGNLNALIGFVENNKIHLTMCGTIPAFLISGGRVSNITDGLCSKGDFQPQKTFANLTTGGLNENDKIILGNIRFYDYLSIERLRRLIDKNSPKESVQEVYRHLKKAKVKDASAIFLELIDQELSKSQSELPEEFFLDQNEESTLAKYYKILSPHLQATRKKAKTGLSSLAKQTVALASRGSEKVSENWQKTYSPKTKELMKSTSGALKNKTKDVFSKVKNSKPINESGVKIRSYVKKSSLAKNDNLNKILTFIGKIFKKENRRYMYATVVIILIIFGYLKIKANNENKVAVSKQHDIVISVDDAAKMFNDAKNEIALGKSDGKDKLLQALALAKTGEQSPSSHDASIKLQRQIQDKLDELSKTKTFYNMSPIFALTGNVKAVLVGTTIYSVSEEGKIYSTDTKDREPVLVSSIGVDNGKITSMTFFDSENQIYMLSDQNKIITFDIKNQVSGDVKIDDGSVFATANTISAFAGNIYLLDSTNGKIWKYTKTATGFSKGVSYSGSNTPAIKLGIDLTIDGNLYMLKQDSTISKFSKGVLSSDFAPKSIPTPDEKVTTPKQIVSDPDSNYLFVLDQSLNRIIKLDKNGVYVNQYRFGGINIDQFFINPRIQKMWVLLSGKVFEIDL